MYQTLHSRNEWVRKKWVVIGAAGLAIISLAACNASPETDLQTPAPTVVDPPVVADETLTETPLGVTEVTDVMTGDQNGRSLAMNDVRQADSHVHGAANLSMALDDAVISVEFETPLYNLLGFEHAPETDTHKKTVEMAEAALSQPGLLIQVNPEAGCTASPVEPMALMPHRDHHHNHDHDDESGSDLDAGHQNALLNYSFTCRSPEQLRWIDVELFEAFENLTEIDLVYLGPAQQMSAGLTPNSNRILLVN